MPNTPVGCSFVSGGSKIFIRYMEDFGEVSADMLV
ncbi:Uncharacterized protein BM_BM1415 [Brugia malayi]|uniref:Uncharacterized protein n=1 Tax=Brugia malayi TaxID=6279 RepID=A0A4E9FBJ5_BRUMA|nr:Uncharacterized protein BM_BM1415 [Brugia malayi]VIO93762.1 Uncharacterized protein BM_BM1415 [Brugia malayi]